MIIGKSEFSDQKNKSMRRQVDASRSERRFAGRTFRVKISRHLNSGAKEETHDVELKVLEARGT